MSPELSRRVGEALSTHVVTPDERLRILAAMETAESWDDLPATIQRLLLEIEARPGRGAP